MIRLRVIRQEYKSMKAKRLLISILRWVGWILLVGQGLFLILVAYLGEPSIGAMPAAET